MEEDGIQKAVELFKSGYNCSQSVVAAFADMYGFTQEQSLRMAASFGGGIGRMRETCGAACGLFLVAGLKTGATEAADREGKAANYAVVQELAAEFKKRNGSLICAELLGLKKKEPVSTIPEERTAQYYSKRPCAKMVEEAARIWVEYLEKHNKLRKKCFFYYNISKKTLNKVFYNIKISIFVPEIKSESRRTG